MKMRRKYGHTDNYNWQSRVERSPVGFKLNHKVLIKQFGQLHYLACHAPVPVTKKWQQVYDNFHSQHFGSHKASMRYLNAWSCHAWL